MATRKSTSTPSFHVDLTPAASTNWCTGAPAQPVMIVNPDSTLGERVGLAWFLAAETSEMAEMFAAHDKVPISILVRINQIETLLQDIGNQAKERGL